MAMAPTLPEGAVPHPWSDGFSWELPAHTPTTLSAEQKAAFDRDGFVVVRDVVEPSLLGPLVAELDVLEAKVESFLAKQEDARFDIAEAGAITFTVHAVLRSTAARELAHHPVLVGLAADLLGPDVNLYWDQAAPLSSSSRKTPSTAFSTSACWMNSTPRMSCRTRWPGP